MSEAFFVSASEAEVRAVKEAVDFCMGMPQPGINPQTQQPIVTEQQRVAMTATWFALEPEQRANPVFWAPWAGWSLEYSNVLPEYTPGTRFSTVVPSDVEEMIAEAESLYQRTPSFEQLGALLAAATMLAPSLESVSWISEPA